MPSGRLPSRSALKLALGLIAQGAGIATGYLLYVVLARTLSAQSFGHLSITFTIGAIGITIAGLGLAMVIVREHASWPGGEPVWPGMGWSFRIVLLSGLATGLLLMLAAWPLASYLFADPELLPFLFAGALVIPPAVVAYHAAGALQARGMAIQAMLFRAFWPSLGLIAFFLILHPLWPSPLSALAAQFLAFLLLALAGLGMTFHAAPRALWQKSAQLTGQQKMLRSGIALAAAGAAGMALAWSFTLILGAFAGAAATGVYALAFRTSLLGNQAGIVCGTIYAPALARAHAEGDRAAQQQILSRVAAISVAGNLAFTVFVLLFADWLLAFFGPEFSAGATALRILAVGDLVATSLGASEMSMQMTGLERELRNNWSGFLPVAVLLSLLLIPPFGLQGAAIASATTAIAMRATMAWQVRRARALDTTLITQLRSLR